LAARFLAAGFLAGAFFFAAVVFVFVAALAMSFPLFSLQFESISNCAHHAEEMLFS
jgi:hypothetical protein